jgi:hypothetical protein
MSCSMGVNVANGRMISASICQSLKMAELETDTHRMMFMYILPKTDREGRHSANPKVLRGMVFTLLDHMSAEAIDKGLKDLERVGLIELWDFNGETVLEVVKFHQHQKIHPKEAPTKYPRLTQGEPKVNLRSTQGEPIPPKINRIESNRKEIELELNSNLIEAEYSVSEEDDPLLDQLVLESLPDSPAPDLSASSEKDFPKSKTPVDIQDTHPFVDSKTTIHEIQTMLEQTSGSPIEPSGSKTFESNILEIETPKPQTNAVKSPHGNEESFRAAGNLRKVFESQLSAVFGKNKQKILSENGRGKLWFVDCQKSLEAIKQARDMARGMGNLQTVTVNTLDDACKEFAKDDLAKPSSSHIRQRQRDQYDEDQREAFVDFAAMSEKEFRDHVSKLPKAHQDFARLARDRLLKRDNKDRKLEHDSMVRKQELVRQVQAVN